MSSDKKFMEKWGITSSNATDINKWFKKLEKSKHYKTSEHPVISEFRKMIIEDPIVRLYMTLMIEQIPKYNKYNKYRIKNIDHYLKLLNAVLTKAPEYSDALLVGTPMNMICLWTMNTPAGYVAYRNQKINAMIKKVLKVWSKFLSSNKSRYVLNTSNNGWFSSEALKKINMNDYKHNPKLKYYGFKSWNNFFTRKLVKGVRPIAEPNNNKIVVSACDCTLHRISKNVKPITEFWIKSQPYSLINMLDNDIKYVKLFTGGTVCQAFLNPFNYHRWHSPISGTVTKAYVKEGLYFTQTEFVGEDKIGPDKSEAYLSSVQTRAIIIIKADDKKLGYVCVMPIGMVEISSCIINKKIKKGYHVTKGEELGYFQFGGSTHCLLFQKDKIKKFYKKKGKLQVGEKLLESI